MAKKPVAIGRWTFDSQAAAIKQIQEVLYRRPLLALIDGDDHEFVLALLSKHDHAAEKIGVGVSISPLRKRRAERNASISLASTVHDRTFHI
jgi:hypothetical protein